LFTGTVTTTGASSYSTNFNYNNCTAQHIGAITSTGTYWNPTSATVTFSGQYNYIPTNYDDTYVITNSVVTLDANSVLMDTNSGTTAYEIYFRLVSSTLYCQGIIDVQYVYLNFEADVNSIGYNQGDIDAGTIYVYATDDLNPGLFYNIGTLTASYINLGYSNIGICAQSVADFTHGVITIVNTGSSDTVWNGEMTVGGNWDFSGWLGVQVPITFQISTFSTGYIPVVGFTIPPQAWNPSDAYYAYSFAGVPIIPTNVISYCKVDTDNAIYAYIGSPPTTCDGINVYAGTTFCALPGVPKPSSPTGGSPGTTGVTTGSGTTGSGVTTGSGTTGSGVTTGSGTTGSGSTTGSKTTTGSGSTTGTKTTTGSGSTTGTKTTTSTTGSASPSSAATLSISLVVSLFISLFLGMF